MSPDISQLLHDAVGHIKATDIAPAVEAGARRFRLRRRVAGVAAVLAVVGGLGAVTWSRDSDSDRGDDVVTSPVDESGAAVFDEPTGVVLIFDDGYDGVTALDLDTGVATRRAVEGQTAGDQSPRLHRSGDALIVGYGPPFAAPLDGRASSALAGEGLSVAVPAAEDGRVWVVDWHNDGPVHTEVFHLVDVVTGAVLGTWDSPTVDGFATVGIDGGLAIQHVTGFTDLWRPDDGGTTRIGDGVPLAASETKLAWCASSCTELHLHDLATGVDAVVQSGGEIRRVAFSPDGERFAVRSATAGGEHVSVFEASTATEIEFVAERTDDYGGLAWSVDGTQLFFHARSVDGVTTVGRIDVLDGDVDIRTLPLDGVLGAVVALGRAEASSFLAATLGDSAQCPPPAIQPSGRTRPCSFRVTAPFVAPVPDDTDFIVYMNPDATQAQIDAAADALTASPEIESFRYRDKDAAMTEFRELFADQPELLASVTEDILPTSFRLVLARDGCVVPPDLDDLAGVRTVTAAGSCT